MSARTVGWSVSLPIAAFLAVTGVVGLFVVKYTDLGARPWAFIFFVMAALSALTSLVLMMLRAREVSD